jgi:hypothetical protein
VPIDFTCEHCGKKARLKDEFAGKRIKCPGCKEAVSIPEEEDEAPPPKRAATRPSKPEPPAKRKGRDEDDEEEEQPRKAARKGRDEEEEEEDEKPRKAARKSRDDEDDEEDERPKKKAKKEGGSSLPLILGIGGGVVGLLLIGFFVWWGFLSGPRENRGPIADGGKKDAGKKDGDRKKEPKLVKYEASEVCKIYRAWQEGKGDGLHVLHEHDTFEIRGTVEKFKSGGMNMVVIRGLPASGDAKAVSIYVWTPKQVPWAIVGLEQVITIRGKQGRSGGFGYGDHVYLEDGEIINPGANVSITINAADLAAEYLKDRTATLNKYKGKGLIVVGKAAADSVAHIWVDLESGGEKVVHCDREVFDTGKTYKKGEEVRIFGRLKVPQPAYGPLDKELLELTGCLAIPGK